MMTLIVRMSGYFAILAGIIGVISNASFNFPQARAADEVFTNIADSKCLTGGPVFSCNACTGTIGFGASGKPYWVMGTQADGCSRDTTPFGTGCQFVENEGCVSSDLMCGVVTEPEFNYLTTPVSLKCVNTTAGCASLPTGSCFW